MNEMGYWKIVFSFWIQEIKSLPLYGPNVLIIVFIEMYVIGIILYWDHSFGMLDTIILWYQNCGFWKNYVYAIVWLKKKENENMYVKNIFRYNYMGRHIVKPHELRFFRHWTKWFKIYIFLRKLICSICQEHWTL